MSMHFEPEKEYEHTVIELRTDTRLAARVVATQGGLTVLIAEGFEVTAGCGVDGRAVSLGGGEIHIAIRERER